MVLVLYYVALVCTTLSSALLWVYPQAAASSLLCPSLLHRIVTQTALPFADCSAPGCPCFCSALWVGGIKRTPTGEIDYSQDFFSRPAYLTVSGQLQGEYFASGLSNIYTFRPTFRAENSHTSRHLAEFWMIEPEIAFCDLVVSDCGMS